MSLIGLQHPNSPFHDPQAWVKWCTHWEETLTWWQELTAIPQKGDVWEFAKRIWASFHMLGECYCTTNGMNDYMAPPTLHCVGHNHYLPLPDMRFSAQDFWLKQPERTLAYAKALQHWVEVAKPLQPGEPCQLAECVKELRRCMRLLTMFMEEQVLSKDPPSPWVMITPSQGPAVVEEEALESWEGKEQQVPESPSPGFFSNPPLLGCSKCLVIPATTVLYSPYPWQVDWHAKYFYTMSVNTSGQPCGAKANASALIHRHS